MCRRIQKVENVLMENSRKWKKRCENAIRESKGMKVRANQKIPLQEFENLLKKSKTEIEKF